MNGVTAYQSIKATAQTKDELVQQHAPLVKRIAYHLIARLPHTVDVNDLIQEGMIGLLDASQNYNVNQGASFETYAGIRIRGAMLDEIRRNNWAPRSVHRKAREIAAAIQEIEQREGRHAQDTEIAQSIGISTQEYHQQLYDSAGHQVFSLDEFNDHDESLAHPISDTQLEPAQEVQQGGFQQALADAINKLPERERLMMSLYYNDELNLKEIGEVLSVSESRVSQIHSQTIIRLRASLTNWLN